MGGTVSSAARGLNAAEFIAADRSRFRLDFRDDRVFGTHNLTNTAIADPQGAEGDKTLSTSFLATMEMEVPVRNQETPCPLPIFVDYAVPTLRLSPLGDCMHCEDCYGKGTLTTCCEKRRCVHCFQMHEADTHSQTRRGTLVPSLAAARAKRSRLRAAEVSAVTDGGFVVHIDGESVTPRLARALRRSVRHHGGYPRLE
jgi:hypothetical protein